MHMSFWFSHQYKEKDKWENIPLRGSGYFPKEKEAPKEETEREGQGTFSNSFHIGEFPLQKKKKKLLRTTKSEGLR